MQSGKVGTSGMAIKGEVFWAAGFLATYRVIKARNLLEVSEYVYLKAHVPLALVSLGSSQRRIAAHACTHVTKQEV